MDIVLSTSKIFHGILYTFIPSRSLKWYTIRVTCKY